MSNSDKNKYKVERCIQHEQFLFKEHKNDIAVVKLEQRITFSNKILPACLQTNRNDLHSSQELVVTGWGHTEGDAIYLKFRLFSFSIIFQNTVEGGTPSNILRKASLKTVDLETCQADFLRSGSEPKDRINESQYCAADPDRNIDACRGMLIYRTQDSLTISYFLITKKVILVVPSRHLAVHLWQLLLALYHSARVVHHNYPAFIRVSLTFWIGLRTKFGKIKSLSNKMRQRIKIEIVVQ